MNYFWGLIYHKMLWKRKKKASLIHIHSFKQSIAHIINVFLQSQMRTLSTPTTTFPPPKTSPQMVNNFRINFGFLDLFPGFHPWHLPLKFPKWNIDSHDPLRDWNTYILLFLLTHKVTEKRCYYFQYSVPDKLLNALFSQITINNFDIYPRLSQMQSIFKLQEWVELPRELVFSYHHHFFSSWCQIKAKIQYLLINFSSFLPIHYSKPYSLSP